MSPRERGPHFDEQTLAVTSVHADEKLTRDQRVERDLDRLSGAGSAERSVGETTTDAVVAAETSAEGWAVRWTFSIQNGQLLARSLALEPEGQRTPPGGLTGEVLRTVSPSRAAAAVAPKYFAGLEDRSEFLNLVIAWRAEDVMQAGPAPIAKRKGGRPRLPDDLLRTVATAYIEELSTGPGVLRRVGERLDQPPETIRDWVRIARIRGFLSPATKAGMKGASPGPRLLDHTDPDGGQS